MGGSDDKEIPNYLQSSDPYKFAVTQPTAVNGDRMRDILSNFSSGKESLQEALNAVRQTSANQEHIKVLQAKIKGEEDYLKYGRPGSYQTGGKTDHSLDGSISSALSQDKAELDRFDLSDYGTKAMENQLFVDPQTAGLAAAQQVQSNPLLSGMFAKGGIQDQRQAQEQQLASRGYSLQPEDYEAYGQASDQIARQYGGMENSLGQALANHGLSAGGGGAAVAYSGLQGNKLEQLGNQQRQIAQARMSTNLARLTQAQSAVNQGATLANSALDQQEKTNFGGVDEYNSMLKQALSAAEDNQTQINTQYGAQGPGFGTTLGQGAAGSFVGKAAGTLGTAAAGAVFGGGGAKKPPAAPDGTSTPSTDPSETDIT